MSDQENKDINNSNLEEVKSDKIELVESNSEKKQIELNTYAIILAEILILAFSRNIFDFIPFLGIKYKKEKRRTMEEKKVELVKTLVDSNIDLHVFDSLITNELNRRLKINFGVTFLIFTFIITIAAYLIIIFNAIYKWNISQIAITVLIIEIPLQFIGLLYIIAKNLFPEVKEKNK